MTAESYKCPKCNGSMFRGFIAERSDNASFVANWIEGEPINRKMFGITGMNVEVHGRRQFGIRSLRCEQCGFLELYAV